MIAWIEVGTTASENVDGPPEDEVQYLAAVLTLGEVGALDRNREATQAGGILVRGTTSE